MIVLHLVKGTEHKVGHIRTLLVARLLWSKWFTRSPAARHIEEMCEALLSHLGSALHNLPFASTLEWACAAFLNI